MEIVEQLVSPKSIRSVSQFQVNQTKFHERQTIREEADGNIFISKSLASNDS